jgi:outer membrane lipoprotein SlyB
MNTLRSTAFSALLAAALIQPFAAQATTAAAPAKTASAVTGVKLGTVQQAQAYEVKGKGSGAGVLAGAVVGGLLGHQVGKGTGNTLATVGGAAAGGYAGNEIEKNAKKHVTYKTTVKFDDGSEQTFHLPQAYALGARVQLKGKRISPAP